LFAGLNDIFDVTENGEKSVVVVVELDDQTKGSGGSKDSYDVCEV
jgi:hypothetical protein